MIATEEFTKGMGVPPPIVGAQYHSHCPNCGSVDIDDISFFPVRIEHGLYSTKHSCNACLSTWVPLPDAGEEQPKFRTAA